MKNKPAYSARSPTIELQQLTSHILVQMPRTPGLGNKEVREEIHKKVQEEVKEEVQEEVQPGEDGVTLAPLTRLSYKKELEEVRFSNPEEMQRKAIPSSPLISVLHQLKTIAIGGIEILLAKNIRSWHIHINV